MKCRRIIGEPDRYWNIKGLGHFVMVFGLNYLRVIRLGRYHFEHIVVSLWYHSWKGMFGGQKVLFRATFDAAVGGRALRSGQVFPIVAHEHEIGRSANSGATAQSHFL